MEISTLNSPRLRFPEFRDKWEINTLGDVAEIKGGKRIPKGYSLQEENNGYPYITVSDMSNGTVSMEKIRYVPFEVINLIKSYTISTEDIFISVAGTLGVVGIIPKQLNNANLTENANKLTNLKCHQIYLLQLLKSERLENLIKSVSTVGAQPKLAIYAIKDFELPFPSLPEQRKIASFITSVDTKIQQLTKKKTLLEQYKKGVMQKIFNQEIRFKDENGKEFPKWVNKELGEVALFFKGKGLPKSDISEEGTTKCIHYGELFTKYKESIKKILSYTDKIDGAFLSVTNDVLMPTSDVTPNGLATASCIKENGVVLGGDVLIIRAPENILDGVFLSYYISCHRSDVMKLVSGSTVYHLYGSDMKNLNISFPTILEQTKIADFLSALDNKIEHTQSLIDKSKLWKKGLLQQLFV